jgi:hypothetical protein
MPASQTHYTSSRMGHSGHAGFGFHSISADVDPGDLQQIGPLGELTLPRDMDLAADQAQLVENAPILLRFRLLESGRWVLIRSRYLGTDYSGRSGNFFAHALIGVPDELRHWPVDYVGWSGWHERLEHDDGQPSPPLEQVSLDRLVPPAELELKALARFIDGDRRRTELLTQMIRAAFLRAETDRAILIRDPGDQGIKWIACIQKAFPRQSSLHLSFCTYQYDSCESEAVNVSVGETNFRFDDADFGYRFFAFDLVDERYSKVPEIAAEYPAVIAGWMARTPARLEAFHRFMEGFDLTALDTGVLLGLRLFQIDQGEIPLPTGADLEVLLGFAEHYTRAQMRDRVVALLADGLETNAADLSATEHGVMVAFLARSARVTGDQTHRERAIEVWIRMFDQLVIARGSALDETRTAKTRLLELDPDATRPLAQRFVGDDHLDAMHALLDFADETVVVHITEEILLQGSVAEPGRAWPESGYGPFLSGLAGIARQPEPLLDLLLGAVADRPNDLAAACRQIAECLRDEGPGKAGKRTMILGCQLALLGSATDAVRAELDRVETHAVLCGEWLQRLADSDDPTALFERYAEHDLPRTPVFAKAADAWLRSRWFERLDDEQAANQAKRWLLAGELARLEPEAMQRAAELLNERLPMGAKSRDSLAIVSPLADLIATQGLQLVPNRALMLATVARVAARERVDWRKQLEHLSGHLDALPRKDYRTLLEQLLSPALADCQNYKDHGKRLLALSASGEREVLIGAYRVVLKDAQLGPALLRQAVKFWLVEATKRRLGASLEPDIEDILVTTLARLKPDQRTNLSRSIGKDDGLSDKAKELWKALALNDRDDYRKRLKPAFDHGHPPLKTTDGSPPAYLMSLRRAGARGQFGRPVSLYLYDPAGEVNDQERLLDQQHYLRHLGGLALLIDPLSFRSLRDVYEGQGRSLPKGTCRSDPLDLIERVHEALERHTGLDATQRFKRRLAVVLTKGDIPFVQQTLGVDVDGRPRHAAWHRLEQWTSERIRGWLRANEPAFFHSLETHFARVELFIISAMGHDERVQGAFQPKRVLEPLLWLLSSHGALRRPVLMRWVMTTAEVAIVAILIGAFSVIPITAVATLDDLRLEAARLLDPRVFIGPPHRPAPPIQPQDHERVNDDARPEPTHPIVTPPLHGNVEAPFGTQSDAAPPRFP